MSNANELMHSILDGLMSMSRDLETLKEKKEMKSDEWRSFCDRKLAQVQQLHGQLRICFHQ